MLTRSTTLTSDANLRMMSARPSCRRLSRGHLDDGHHDLTPCKEISEYRPPEQYSASYGEHVDVPRLDVGKDCELSSKYERLAHVYRTEFQFNCRRWHFVMTIRFDSFIYCATNCINYVLR